jgi:endonuclease/exonuclease/phosphatase family metal-dependent hydrolase
LVAAVTHLDHIGAEARYQQACLIAEWSRQQTHPLILTGDFNAGPTSRVHSVLTASATRLRDTWKMLNQPESEQAYTHHGFSGTPQITRMDWILVGDGLAAVNVRIIQDHVTGRYPSDHFPVMADLEFVDERADQPQTVPPP